MLRYAALGSKFLLGLFFAFAAAAAYLPFLEAFALTPAIAFIHRFSITINLGTDTKTLQPIVFIIPILLVKGLWEYHKKYGILTLLKSNLVKIIAILVLADIISIFTSTSRGSSIGTFITHGMNFAVFITSSIWLKLVSDYLNKENLKKFGIKLVKTFAIALVFFTVLNTLVTTTQFFDCSLSNTGCSIWKTIDDVFPNKLLLVGHQKFSYKPNIIRAPGFFGDVNFNGMYSLLIVLIFGTLLVTSSLIVTPKGYEPKREQKLLLIPIVAGLISFLFTISRSAILGAGITGIVLFIVVLLPILKNISVSKELITTLTKAVSIGLASIVILFALGYLVPLSYNGRNTSMSKEIVRYVTDMFSPEEDSAQGHAKLFASAITIGNQNPLTGMGLGTFGIQYEKLIRPGTGTNASPHSTYGLLYAEQGIIGLAAYIGVILYFWYLSIKSTSRLIRELIQVRKTEKKISRDMYLTYGSKLFLLLISFGIPFFSVATISYYGFFLPMTWWWGNGELL